MNYAVIGANYGDEGKGLVTDYLTRSGRNVVIRHNGGAQSGHTVEKNDGRRFVFHELSSGSFNGAVTYWASTFYPDLYKLEEELEDFSKVGEIPQIYGCEKTNIVLLFDVAINQMKETGRGDKKHGSCGMGIWEARVRTESGFGMTLGEVKNSTPTEIVKRLEEIKENYVLKTFGKLSPDYDFDIQVYTKYLKRAIEHVNVISDETSFLGGFDNIVFESGQGLLLDSDREDLWPHTTSSCTTLANPAMLAQSYGINVDDVFYVTRTYITRHGAGPFNEDKDLNFYDETNKSNPWQGSMRFGRTDFEELLKRVSKDGAKARKISLFITHFDETNERFLSQKGNLDQEQIVEKALSNSISDIYFCKDKYGIEVTHSNK